MSRALMFLFQVSKSGLVEQSRTKWLITLRAPKVTASTAHPPASNPISCDQTYAPMIDRNLAIIIIINLWPRPNYGSHQLGVVITHCFS